MVINGNLLYGRFYKLRSLGASSFWVCTKACDFLKLPFEVSDTVAPSRIWDNHVGNHVYGVAQGTYHLLSTCTYQPGIGFLNRVVLTTCG